MRRNDLFWRLVGLIILAAAGGVTLFHREVWMAARNGPATALEAALGLAAFLLASYGVLLLIHGVRLRDGWSEVLADADNKRSIPQKIGSLPPEASEIDPEIGQGQYR